MAVQTSTDLYTQLRTLLREVLFSATGVTTRAKAIPLAIDDA